MRCVCFEEKDKTCQAVVCTTPWKPDDSTKKDFCETMKFRECPRLCAYMDYKIAISTTLKVKTK